MEDLKRFVVRVVKHPTGETSHWIFAPDGALHVESVAVLARYGRSTQATYAYSLVDHLNWAYCNDKPASAITLRDLQRYMHSLTGDAGVHGVAWRAPDSCLGPSAAANVATIVKAYYLSLSQTVRPELLTELAGVERNWRSSRRVTNSNPLSPKKPPRRPRFLPDAVVEALFQPGVLLTARDVMIVTWLHDSGIRVGGLCGLRTSDLHLIPNHPCGQREDPHIHIIARDDNPNGARAKAPVDRRHLSNDGYIINGVIRAVSEDMISTYFAYLLDEYLRVEHLVDSQQVLVHVRGATCGRALTTSGVRGMLRRASERAGLDSYVTPHAFRHKSAAALYEASDFNAELVAQEFGWASPQMVTELYGRTANRESRKHLQRAWDNTARPHGQDH